jgi:hypothetical protein
MLLFSLSLICASASAAIMIFFGAGVAPVVFGRLEEAQAGRVVRALFPRYYLILAILTGLAGLSLVALMPMIAFVYLVCTGAFVYARQILMPQINTHRDAMMAGDDEAATQFDALHKRSVRINIVQLVVIVLAMAASVFQQTQL